MSPLTQNKKIALSAIGIFIVSFISMIFFLKNSGGLDHMKTDIINMVELEEQHEKQIKIEKDKEIVGTYRSYLDDPNANFVVTTPEGELKQVSSGFSEMLGMKGEKPELSVFDLINSRDLPGFVVQHTKLIQDGKTVKGIGPYRMLKGDVEILVLMDMYPILDEDGKVSEIVISGKDLTSQVEELKEQGEGAGSDWIENLYPKINEMQNSKEFMLLVDKITYKE